MRTSKPATKMASSNNPLEEILNSDVADSPFSALVRPIDTSITSPAGRDSSNNVLQTADRSNHLYGAEPMTLGHSSSNSSNGNESHSTLQSSGTMLQNHTLSVIQTTKGFNNGTSTPQLASFAVPQSVTSLARGNLNIQTKTETSRNSPVVLTQASSDQFSGVKGYVSGQQVVVTVANPAAASVAQSLTNYLNTAKFNNPTVTLANMASTGLSSISSDLKANLSTEHKPLVVTNVGSNLVVQPHGTTGPVQVISQLQPSQHVISNVVSMAQVKTENVTSAAATNLKPYSMTGQQNLTTGQQNLTVIQSSLPQGAVGFPSQHVQIVNMPAQNVHRGSVAAPVSNLRTLAPRIAVNQPTTMRLPTQQQPNLPTIRPQGVMTGPISFGSNVLPGNLVLLKNERGQMIMFQNPQQVANASNSQVLQSTNTRPTIATGQIGLVQPGQSGQGLIAVSSGQFIRQPMTGSIQIPSSGHHGILQMQSSSSLASSMATVAKQQMTTTTPQSTVLSTPSIVSRLVQPNSIAQVTVTHPPSSSGPAAAGSAAVGVATTPNIKDVHENVRKCKNFLSTLIKLASNQPEETVSNVRNLIQGLIDGNVEPEDFTNQLQKELKSSPQPYLVPFLRKSLPFLRQSLYYNRMTIDGIRAPPASVANLGVSLLPVNTTAQVFSAAMAPGITRPRPALPNAVTNKPSVPTQVQQLTTLQQQQQQQIARLALIQQQTNASNTRMLGVKPQLTGADQTKTLLTRPALLTLPTASGSMAPPIGAGMSTVTATSNGLIGQLASAAAAHKGEKRKYDAIRDDDDINDVATMGGVNLTEESRNILATNSELVSGQLRSCKDEKFLDTQLLSQRINSIAQRRGLEGASGDVAGLVSHAVQEYLRTLMEELAVAASHRLENYKNDPRFEVSNDTKAQLKFLEELGSLERKRHEEAERGILMRAAKSRAKVEDPEQAKLKQKARAMQQAEMDEMRHREANLTALAAIGPRKLRAAQGSSSSTDPGTSVNNATVPVRPRIRRVNLRDFLFVLEQRKDTRRSLMLYKAFLK